MTSSRQAEHTFARTASQATRARHIVAERLEAWGLSGERQAVELVVSELFANAVRHGAGTVSVRLMLTDQVVRLEVADEGGGQPGLRPTDPTGVRPGGWGLHLVHELADDWGTEVTEGRTVVWAERAVRR